MFVRLSCRMKQLGSHWTDFHETSYLSIFRKFAQKIQVPLQSDKNNRHFTWRPLYIFVTKCRWILLRIKNIPDKSCTENQHIDFIFNTFSSENRAVYEIMWKNIVQPDRPQTTIWRMRYAYWIPKSTNTHSEYAIIIVFPLQRRLNERASMLRHTHTVCLVYSTFIHYYQE